jgi:ComF family protein
VIFEFLDIPGLFNKVIKFIFPFRCSTCNNLTDTGEGICSSCWPKFNFINKPYCFICCKKFEVDFSEVNICAACVIARPKIDMIRTLLEFSPATKKLVHNFKYHDKTSLAKLFAKLINNRFSEDLKDIDIITPVPMHKLKRIFRGYNPPQILAWELSKKLAKPFLPNLLIKKKITKNQVGLTKKERTKNILDSFELNKNFNIQDKVILLVDDVITTGATTTECTKILKRGKAGSVKLVTIARV